MERFRQGLVSDDVILWDDDTLQIGLKAACAAQPKTPMRILNDRSKLDQRVLLLKKKWTLYRILQSCVDDSVDHHENAEKVILV